MKTLLADSLDEALFVSITLELSYSEPNKYVVFVVRKMEIDHSIFIPTKTLKIGYSYKSSLVVNGALRSYYHSKHSHTCSHFSMAENYL